MYIALKETATVTGIQSHIAEAAHKFEEAILKRGL